MTGYEPIEIELDESPDDDVLAFGRGPRRVVRGSAAWRGLVGGATLAAASVAVLLAYALPVLDARLLSRLVALFVALAGLQFVVGHAGQLSLCHGAFVGAGSYGTTIAVVRFGWPHPLALVFAGAVGFALGGLVGMLAVRLRATYLGPVTLSVAVVFPMVVKRFSWFTGGSSGLPLVRQMRPPGWLGLSETRGYLWNHMVIVAVAVLALAVARNVVLGPFGLAVRAVAENPLSAAASGVNVRRTRIVAYAWGAALGALGGGLLVIDTPVVGADSYDLFRSLGYYAAVMVGGAASLVGAFVASALLVGVPWLVESNQLGSSPNLVLGALLVLSTIAAPRGFAVPLRDWLAGWLQVRDPLEEDRGDGPDGRTLGADGAGSVPFARPARGEPDGSGGGRPGA